MAKTRNQTGELGIKKEEQEDCKPTLGLNSVTRAARNKITKRPSRNSNNNNNRRLPAPEIKVEEDTDTKSLLRSTSKHPKLPKGQHISQEQINQLIDYVVNHGMSVKKASRKAKMSFLSGYKYYNLYKNDPDKKVPSPRNRFTYPPRVYTQEHIGDLIRYIVDDKMTIPKASEKANMSYVSGRKYYSKYLKDPNHAIPIPPSRQKYTQDQKNDFMSYIINDKMSIKTAAERANIMTGTGYSHYYRHLNNQTHDIYTSSPPQEEKKKFISYITERKMSIRAASKKANMDPEIGKAYYQQYLNNLHQGILKPSHIVSRLPCTQERIDNLIRYIVEDKITVKAASKKAYMCTSTGHKYYNQLVRDRQ